MKNALQTIKASYSLKKLKSRRKEIATRYVSNDHLIKRAAKLKLQQKDLNTEFKKVHTTIQKLEGVESSDEDDPNSYLLDLCLA